MWEDIIRKFDFLLENKKLFETSCTNFSEFIFKEKEIGMLK